MDENSNDLYNQIMKNLEEKKKKEDLAIEDLDIKEEKISSDITTDDSKSKMIAEFLEEQDYYTEKEVESKMKNKKTKEKINKKEELDNKDSFDMKDVRKTRRLLRFLIIIQILLLGVLLFILYNKIFDTQYDLSPSFNSESSTGVILMEGYLEIPSIDLAENIYENTDKINFSSLVLFDTLNGLNRIGNSTISSITKNGYGNKNIFSDLNKVKADDKIYISLENSDPLEYNVIEVKEVDETDLEVLVSTEKTSVTLIANTKEDSKRLIVKAEVLSEEKDEVVEEKPEPKNNYKVTTNDLNVREKPSFNNTPIASLNTGDIVEVITKKGDWYEIKYNNKVAYVSAKYLKKTTEKPVQQEKVKPKIESVEDQLTKLKEKYEKLP